VAAAVPTVVLLLDPDAVNVKVPGVTDVPATIVMLPVVLTDPRIPLTDIDTTTAEADVVGLPNASATVTCEVKVPPCPTAPESPVHVPAAVMHSLFAAPALTVTVVDPVTVGTVALAVNVFAPLAKRFAVTDVLTPLVNTTFGVG
jgi:hypothetical protein